MHKSDFSRFSDPFMLSVDASGIVPVGVRPPPPLWGSSPCEAGQFCHPHGEQKRRYVPRRIYQIPTKFRLRQENIPPVRLR